jgi:NAD+ kinase
VPSKSFSVIGVICKPNLNKAEKLAYTLVKYLYEKRITVLVEPELFKMTEKFATSSTIEKMRADLIISIGGDGTILRTCRLMFNPETPILGINVGGRGFLTEVEADDAISAIDKCLSGKFWIDKCTKISSKIGETIFPDALNEVLIATSHPPSKMTLFHISIDNSPLFECKSDGLIFSTSIGSTAHSYSAGGPILKTDAFAITPICPFVNLHSVVVPVNSTIKASVESFGTAIVVDGVFQKIIKENYELTIHKSKYKAQFIRFSKGLHMKCITSSIDVGTR